MGRHLTTDIKIENTNSKEYRNIIKTIVTDKLKKRDDVFIDKHGRIFSSVRSTLQEGKIKKYRNGELYISTFLYQTKDSHKNRRRKRGYITYDEYLTFQRNENINNTLDLPSEIIDNFPKLKIPFEVKKGDKLFSKGHYGKRKEIIVERVTPRTFFYSLLQNDNKKKYKSRIMKSYCGSSIWYNNIGGEICK